MTPHVRYWIVIIATVAVIAIIASASCDAGATIDRNPAALSEVQGHRYKGLTLKQWYRRAHRAEHRVRALRRALRSKVSVTGGHWLERAFTCIHNHEGRWNDPNPLYYGGLQMDLAFQRSHGSEFLRYFGTADKWPVSVQYAVAIRAYMTRGFGPWPTRRYCGL